MDQQIKQLINDMDRFQKEIFQGFSRSKKDQKRKFNQNDNKLLTQDEKKIIIHNINQLPPCYQKGILSIISEDVQLTSDTVEVNFDNLPPKKMRHMNQYAVKKIKFLRKNKLLK